MLSLLCVHKIHNRYLLPLIIFTLQYQHRYSEQTARDSNKIAYGGDTEYRLKYTKYMCTKE